METPEYVSYTCAKNRCNNPNNQAYARYGGRGIKFLFESFQEFINCLGIRPTPQHTLDRIDNDGHYCKENCRWATRKEQIRNQSRSLYINGVFHQDISKKLGSEQLVKSRIKRGWSQEDAIKFKAHQSNVSKNRKIQRLEVSEDFMIKYLRMITAHEDIILTYKGKDVSRDLLLPARKGQINGSGDPTKKKVNHTYRVKKTYTPYFKALLDKHKELSI